MPRLLWTLTVVAGLSATLHASPIIDSVNAHATPSRVSYWSAAEVGWYYTPPFTYFLDGVSTKFGHQLDFGGADPNDPRAVTVEVYSDWPGAGDGLLRSGTFQPVGDTFAGATFVPIELDAGRTYFIGFRNISGLPSNFTFDQNANILLGGTRYGFNGDGQYPQQGNGFPNDRPILAFSGALAVPEPVGAVLFGIGFLAAGAGAMLRRKAG